MIITAKSGLTVRLSEIEYGETLLRSGSIESAKYRILSTAGRVHKHRRQLLLYAEQSLTTDERQSVECLAWALVRQAQVDEEMIRLGYGNYITRRERGGRMPESYERIRSRAMEQTGPLPPALDDRDRIAAMRQLGFLTADDAEHSARIVRDCNWEITAPSGWDREADPTCTTATSA